MIRDRVEQAVGDWEPRVTLESVDVLPPRCRARCRGCTLRREARLAARFEDCEVVVYGHTHVPQVERFQHLWVLNPGSPTERRTAPTHSMIVLTIQGTRLMPELVTL